MARKEVEIVKYDDIKDYLVGIISMLQVETLLLILLSATVFAISSMVCLLLCNYNDSAYNKGAIYCPFMSHCVAI